MQAFVTNLDALCKDSTIFNGTLPKTYQVIKHTWFSLSANGMLRIWGYRTKLFLKP